MATDPALLPPWQANMVSAVPEGGLPLRLGSRIRGPTPGAGRPGDARLGFEPVTEPTCLRFRVHGQEGGRLAQPRLWRVLERHFRRDWERLKRELEGPG